jgi:hypothetical protein
MQPEPVIIDSLIFSPYLFNLERIKIFFILISICSYDARTFYSQIGPSKRDPEKQSQTITKTFALIPFIIIGK